MLRNHPCCNFFYCSVPKDSGRVKTLPYDKLFLHSEGVAAPPKKLRRMLHFFSQHLAFFPRGMV